MIDRVEIDQYPTLTPKIAHQGPKIKSRSNVIIKGNIENENCSSTLVNSKTVFEPGLNPEDHKRSRLKKLEKIFFENIGNF